MLVAAGVQDAHLRRASGEGSQFVLGLPCVCVCGLCVLRLVACMGSRAEARMWAPASTSC